MLATLPRIQYVHNALSFSIYALDSGPTNPSQVFILHWHKYTIYDLRVFALSAILNYYRTQSLKMCNRSTYKHIYFPVNVRIQSHYTLFLMEIFMLPFYLIMFSLCYHLRKYSWLDLYETHLSHSAHPNTLATCILLVTCRLTRYG